MAKQHERATESLYKGISAPNKSGSESDDDGASSDSEDDGPESHSISAHGDAHSV